MGRWRNGAILALAGVLLVAACAGRKASPPIQPLPEACEAHRPDLTVEQLLADYDEMWQIIQQNYPLMGVVQRTYPDLDIERVWQAYRNTIASMAGRPFTAEKKNAVFEGAVQAALRELGGQGHLWYVDAENYSHYAEVYYQVAAAPPCAYDYAQLRRPESVAWYGYQPGPLGAAEDRPVKSSLEMNVEDGVAVIRVPSFDLSAMAADRPVWRQFYKKAQGCHDMVIDIRGNPGGSTLYWKELIAGPNIKGPTKVEQVRLVRGQAAIDYQTLTGDSYYPIEEYHLRPKDNEEDVGQMTGFFVETQVIEPTTDKPAFAGRIWILVDQGVYSASEGFANWCKSTGFATLVGQPTGGDGMGTDPQVFSLRHTGLCFRFSSALGLNPDGGSNEEFGTVPDVWTEEGQDAMQVCMEKLAALGEGG